MARRKTRSTALHDIPFLRLANGDAGKRNARDGRMTARMLSWHFKRDLLEAPARYLEKVLTTRAVF